MALLETKIRDLIGTKPLLRLAPSTSVSQAATEMSERHVGAVLVYRDETLIGIFTERDMLERVVAADLSPGATLLQDVMTPDPTSIAGDASVLDAIFAMKERFSRHLLVKQGTQVVGIVSVRDLLRAVVESRLKDQQQFDDLFEGFPV